MNRFFVKPITMGDIRPILKAALMSSRDESVQLSIISRSLITAAKTAGIPKSLIIKEIERTWDETKSLQELNGIVAQ